MYQAERAIVIDEDLERVYAIAQTYPRFVNFYKNKDVIFESQEKIVARMAYSFYGIVFNWEGEGVKNKNKSINFTQTKGLLKGLRASWVFEPQDNKTKVIIRTELRFNSFFGKIFEKPLGFIFIPNTLTKILLSLKNSVENKASGIS